jgi:putative DNA primase/helicase
LQSRAPEEFASCTDRIGWHGRAFVLPKETIGDNAERIVFQSESPIENTFKAKGTPEQWIERVGLLCAGNSRLVFAVACAFGGPLLRPAGMESGGFHIHGSGSTGKSTAQFIAASVYGAPNFKRSFRQTDNALEGVAGQHNDCLLILDEISQVEPRVIGEVIYMLGNGEGKTRATRTATPRPPMRWQLLYLCSGEKKLSDIMAEAQKKTNAGQETRLAHIPADAGAGLGAFEDLHTAENGSAFSKHITAQAAAVYGATGRAWLHWLTTNADTLKSNIKTMTDTLSARMIPANVSGQVARVGARFALVGAAGEMATAAGLTGWPVGESENAAIICFNAWLAARGGSGDGEILTMLRQVRRFLETHGEARFALWHRQGDDHNSKTLQRAGFRRVFTADGEPFKDIGANDRGLEPSMSYVIEQGGAVNYYVLPECFRTEICSGFDYKAVARVLVDSGCLQVDKGRSFDAKHRLPGMGKNPVACYVITPEIFSLDL